MLQWILACHIVKKKLYCDHLSSRDRLEQSFSEWALQSQTLVGRSSKSMSMMLRRSSSMGANSVAGVILYFRAICYSNSFPMVNHIP